MFFDNVIYSMPFDGQGRRASLSTLITLIIKMYMEGLTMSKNLTINSN